MPGSVIVRFKGDTTELKGAIGSVEGDLDGFSKKVGAIGGRITDVGKSLTTKVTLPIVGMLGLATKAAAEDDQAQKILDKQIKDNTGATEDQIAGVERWINKVQNATGVLDDNLRPAYASLIRVTKDNTEAQSLMNTVMDIAAGTGLDVETVAKAVAKAHEGNTGALSKLGIQTKDTKGETLSFEQIMANANKTFGGDAAAAADTASGRFAIMKAKLSDLTETIGGMLLPILDRLTDWVSTLAEWFGKLDPQWQTAIVAAIGLAAALGPVLTIGGHLVTVISALISPVGLVVLAIAALVAGFIYAYTHFQGFRDAVDNVVSWLRDTAWPAIQTFAQGVVDAFQSTVAWAQDNWPKVKAVIDAVVSWLRDDAWPVVQQIVGWISQEWSDLAAWTSEHWASIQEAISHVWVVIQDVINVALTVIKAYITAWVTAIQTAWSVFGDSITEVAVAVWGGIRDTISAIIRGIRDVIQFVLDLINGDWGDAWNDVMDILRTIWDQMSNIVSTAMGVIKGVITGAKDAVAEAFHAMWDPITNIVSGAWDGIVGAVLGGANAVIGVVNWVIDKINGIGFDIPSVHIPGTDIDVGGWSFHPFNIGHIPTLGAPPSVNTGASGGVKRFAKGGWLGAGQAGIVGERGPELFVPGRGGTIIPSGGGGGVVIELHVTSLDPRQAGDVVVDALTTWGNRNGPNQLRRALGVA